MSIFGVIITIIVVGFLLYLATRFVPMDATVKQILIGVVVLILILWLLQVFAVFSYLGNPSIPRVHQ